MAYFTELPNVEYVNRFPNTKSNDETTLAKNIFRRVKVREDLISVFAGFEYYTIVEGERPDQIAEKLYGDAGLDWVILVSNNIINYYDQWPLTVNEFNNYLISKYGTEDALQEIHHYETIELRDSFNRVVLPKDLIVDETFYNAPEYETITETPPGITFPPIYLNPVVAITSCIIESGGVTEVDIIEEGFGYKQVPKLTFSDPTITSSASASVGIQSFRVSSVTSLTPGFGYKSVPVVSISTAPTSIQAVGVSSLGQTEFTGGTVVSVEITNSGCGYGLTPPSVSFSLPQNFISNTIYREQSPVSVGNQIEGMYVKSDGHKVYTASTVGSNLIKEFTLSTAWNITTLSLSHELDVSAVFSYCTGIEFSPDGTKMFVTGGLSGNFFVAAYNLSTPWSISTATYVNQTSLTAPGGVRFKSDGSRMYSLNMDSPDSIEEYTLSSAWNVTTKSLVASYNIETPTGDNQIIGFSFFNGGNKMYATGLSNSTVYEFNLNSWDLTTLTFSSFLYVGDRIPNPSDAFISSDVEHLLVSGGSGDSIFEYSIKVRAKGTANLVNGSLNSITISEVGFGYTTPPSVTIGAPYPAVNATATATVIDGSVLSVNITNAGFGYTVAPTVTIAPAPTYSRATGIASVVDGKISAITITSPGENYDNPPSITFDISPEQVLNVEVDETYTQNNKIWKWNGTVWQEQITRPFQFLDGLNIISVNGSGISKPITNLEYELRLNEEKTLIIVPKPAYISTIIDDLKKIMKYNKDSENVVSSKLKRTYNPKFTGV